MVCFVAHLFVFVSDAKLHGFLLQTIGVHLLTRYLLKAKSGSV